MKIPEKARGMIEKGLTIAMATSSREGYPNVAPMLQYWWFGEDRLVIGDLFMKATRKNVEETGRVSLYACDDETGEAYKYCGTAMYEREGEACEMANANLHKKKPDMNFKGVVVATITEVYVATRGKMAGQRIAP